MSLSGDRLFYFSRSADKAPGKGINEFTNNPKDYSELSLITDWRKVLSNFYLAPLKIDGYTWNTVEHYFQGAKIGLVDPVKQLHFTVESCHVIGLGDGNAARSARKYVFLSPEQLNAWQEIMPSVLERALTAKFTQYPDLGQVLKLTGKAELWHSAGRGAKPKRQTVLEAVRALI